MGDFLTQSDFVVNILCSTLTLILITCIFYRINERLSFPFIFVLSLYGVAGIMRVLKLTLVSGTSEQIRSLINVVALCVQLFSLQYFIFAVSEYKVKMDSASLADYKRRYKNVRITKYVMLTIQFLTSFAKIYVEFVEPNPFQNNNDDYQNQEALRIILVLAMSMRILENVFMMFYAIYNITFFVRMKIRNLSAQR